MDGRPLPDPVPEFLKALDEYSERADVRLTSLGMHLMDSWNYFEQRRPLGGPDLAVTGHLDGDSYKFAIGRGDRMYEITVKDVTV